MYKTQNGQYGHYDHCNIVKIVLNDEHDQTAMFNIEGSLFERRRLHSLRASTCQRSTKMVQMVQIHWIYNTNTLESTLYPQRRFISSLFYFNSFGNAATHFF